MERPFVITANRCRYCLGATRRSSPCERAFSLNPWRFRGAQHCGLLKAVRSSFEKKVRPPEYAAQAAILRDIAAIPSGPSIPQRKRSLGERDGCRDCEAIDESQAFERLPDLAEAMLNAGCHDVEVLSHCQAAGLISAVVGWSTW